MTEVEKWLIDNNHGQYYPLFEENELFNMSDIIDLPLDLLKEIGLKKVGPRM